MDGQELKKSYFRQYMREYRKKNKEKIRQYNNNYWAKKAALERLGIHALEAELQELKKGPERYVSAEIFCR
jgi:hypothetical protein